MRASSLVENLNSRLRTYFFLRRQLGNDYLTLLQFFLNHRRYLRSDDPSRVGKSPAELLTGRAARSLAGASGVHPVLADLRPRHGNQRRVRKPAPRRDRSGSAQKIPECYPKTGVLEPGPK